MVAVRVHVKAHTLTDMASDPQAPHFHRFISCQLQDVLNIFDLVHGSMTFFLSLLFFVDFKNTVYHVILALTYGRRVLF